MNAHTPIPTKATKIKPGIYFDMPNEDYHSGPGISKSGLWTIETKTPAHYKFAVRKETKAFDFGEGCHLAILQPNLFEAQVIRGPEDRRGNKWKDMVEACAINKKLLLTGGDYDSVLALRDAVHSNRWISNILTGGKPLIEASGYWIDEATGELCRCRPDFYREDLGVIVDVKSTLSAHPDAFARSVINYGYHSQEAFYSDGWQALGKPIDGFVFLGWEKTAPFAFAAYELPPSIVDEGRAVMRKALTTYAECTKANNWPGFPEGVQELPIKRWAYRLTAAPDLLDQETE